MLAQVVRRTCARRSGAHRLASTRWHSPDPCGRALDSVRPYPSRGWVLASEPGAEDLPERRERRRARSCARTLACLCARLLHWRFACSPAVCHFSGYYVRALGSHRDIQGAPGAAGSVAQMGRACLRVVYGLWRACSRIAIRPMSVVDFCAHVCRVTRTQKSGPLWSLTMMLDVLDMLKCIELTWYGRLDA